MNKNIKKMLPWMFAAGAVAASPLEKAISQSSYSQELNPSPVGAPLVPGRMAKEQGEVYNFSGKIRNVLDSTAVAGAELTFTSPEGVKYKTTTDGSGKYATTIDTYVETAGPDEIMSETALSSPLMNPTGGRTAFVVNVPGQTQAQFKVYNVLGQELKDVVDGPINGSIGRGRYQLNINMGGKAAGVYVAVLETPDGVISQPFTYMHGAGSFNENSGRPVSWKGFGKSVNAAAGGWTLKINKPGDFYERETVLTPTPGANSLDESMLPSSFDLAFFNSLNSRDKGAGTTRWMQVPKLYIIDGPLEGYTGFETPTAEQIEIIKNVWKKDIKPFTNYFIDVPDSKIYVGHDVNDTTFKQAVEQIGNGSVKRKKGWNVVLWTNTLPGAGGHQETMENGVIVDAQQRYDPSLDAMGMKGIGDIETAQSMGFPEGPADRNKRYDYTHLKFTDLFIQCGKLNYSRAPNTMSPDRSTR